MNEDIFKGKFKQLRGAIKQQWGKLTDDQIDQIDGSREKFVGRLQESYGLAREDAEKQLTTWEKTQSSDDRSSAA